MQGAHRHVAPRIALFEQSLNRYLQGFRNRRDFVVQNRTEPALNFCDLRLVQLDAETGKTTDHVFLNDLWFSGHPDSKDGSPGDIPTISFVWHGALDGAAMVDLFVARIIRFGNKRDGLLNAGPYEPMNVALRQSVAAVTLTAYFFVFCGCSTRPEITATERTPVTAEQFIATHQNSAPSSLRVGQLAELAIAYCLQGEHEKALEVAQVGLSKASSSEQKAGFHALLSQNLGALGRNEEAGQSAVAGQRYSPNNKLLALYRIANFERSGNRMQADIARNHLMQIDPDFALNPTLDPITAGVIVAVSCFIAATTVVVVVSNKIFDTPNADPNLKIRLLGELGRSALFVFGKELEIQTTFAEIGPVGAMKRTVR